MKVEPITFNNYAKYVRLAKRIGEMPPNYATPKNLVNYIRSFSKAFVESNNALGDPRLKLLKAVGQSGYMVQITHKSDLIATGLQPTVLIGKGVTFDTGGYNLKSRNMHEMKFDKCGAAAVYSVLQACAEQDYPLPVVGLIPLVENLIGSKMTLPGSVIKAANGTRVEIRDTDAEGRLILADAIQIANKLDPDVIVTVATLTGSCSNALGDIYTGLFANKNVDAWNYERIMQRSGLESGDEVWSMPLHKSHTANLKKTHIADILNYNKREFGGSSGAAFLNYFVDPNIPWLHLDIAGTAWREDKSTGRPVKLLLKFLENNADERLGANRS